MGVGEKRRRPHPLQNAPWPVQLCHDYAGRWKPHLPWHPQRRKRHDPYPPGQRGSGIYQRFRFGHFRLLLQSGCDRNPKINDLGIPFAYDFSEEFTEDTLKEYCPHVDYCFLSCNQQGSEEQIQALLRRIHSYGPKIVVGTRGAEGADCFRRRTVLCPAKRPLLQWWIPWAPGILLPALFP